MWAESPISTLGRAERGGIQGHVWGHCHALQEAKVEGSPWDDGM